MEIINTGNLRRLKYEDDEEVKVIKLFLGIYGVGACPSLHLRGPSSLWTERRPQYCADLVYEWVQDA